jgi:hypothetical protein
VQERAGLRDRDGLYNVVLSPIFALSGDETTPAHRGRYGLSGKDGTLLVQVAPQKRESQIVKIILLNGTWRDSRLEIKLTLLLDRIAPSGHASGRL